MAATASRRLSPGMVIMAMVLTVIFPILTAGCSQNATPSSPTKGKMTALVGSSGMKMILTYQPNPPIALKPFHAQVHLASTKGQPVTHAQVTMYWKMVDMNMPAQKVDFKNDGAGNYHGHAIFFMAGPWKLTTDIITQGKTLKESLTVHVSN